MKAVDIPAHLSIPGIWKSIPAIAADIETAVAQSFKAFHKKKPGFLFWGVRTCAAANGGGAFPSVSGG
jgi:hypothetical protein